MGLDLLDIADADDRIPVFWGNVLDYALAIEPELEDVAAGLGIIHNTVLDCFPEQIIPDDPLEGSQLIILVCRYFRDLAGYQVRPEPGEETVEIDYDPEISALIGPELADFILPDLIMLPSEELGIPLIELEPGLSIGIIWRPGLPDLQDGLVISDQDNQLLDFRDAALVWRFSAMNFGISWKWETHIRMFSWCRIWPVCFGPEGSSSRTSPDMEPLT